MKVEKMGTGIKRINKAMTSAYLNKAVFTHYEHSFYVELRDKDYEKDGIKDGINLINNQKKIIILIKEKNNITAHELSSLISINKRSVEKNLTLLQEKGFLRRIGSRRNGSWEIVL